MRHDPDAKHANSSIQIITNALNRTRLRKIPAEKTWKASILRDAGLPEKAINHALQKAAKWHISLRSAVSLYTSHDEILCYWTLAQHLNVTYCGHVISAQTKPVDTALTLGEQRLALGQQDRGYFTDPRTPEKTVWAPELEELPILYKVIEDDPDIKKHIVLACPTTLRKAAILEREVALAKTAVSHLELTQPGQCAARVLSRTQLIIGMLILLALPYLLILFPTSLRLVCSLFLAVFFGLVVTLRLYAVYHACLPRAEEPANLKNNELPSYSVLVPLYQEANMLETLVKNLGRLDYPRALLDIKIILEANDHETIEAAQKLLPGAPFELVIVPSIGPQTKPKALNYTLPLCRSELICIYDAEDNPATDQLRRAAAKLKSDPKIGAVQCVLSIKNHSSTWFSKLFALEYEALFGGFLPALESLGMPLPLGGTSNHFRKSVLEETGAWDPYNVAEDADLGIRLARHGYHCATLQNATTEEAPLYFRQWLPQRTRWFKGWVQSWLVHMRNPQHLLVELGHKNFLATHLILAGMFMSAALHPLFAFLAMQDAAFLLDRLSKPDDLQKTMIALNLFNLIAGYCASMALCMAVKWRSGSPQSAIIILYLPIYWWMMSLAAWRSVWQLMFNPFKWEKTPHGLADKAK